MRYTSIRYDHDSILIIFRYYISTGQDSLLMSEAASKQ